MASVSKVISVSRAKASTAKSLTYRFAVIGIAVKRLLHRSSLKRFVLTSRAPVSIPRRFAGSGAGVASGVGLGDNASPLAPEAGSAGVPNGVTATLSLDRPTRPTHQRVNSRIEIPVSRPPTPNILRGHVCDDERARLPTFATCGGSRLPRAVTRDLRSPV